MIGFRGKLYDCSRTESRSFIEHDPNIAVKSPKSGENITVSFTVTNTGTKKGDEVAQ